MEDVKINPETQLSNTEDGPWGKRYKESVPKFRGDKEMETDENNKSHMKNLEQIHDCEIKMVANNPDVLGYNIDSKLMVWPKRRKMAMGFKYGDEKALAKQYGISEQRVLEAVEEENSKVDLLDDILNKLPDGVRFRINPYAPQSAFSVINSEPITNENGEKRFHINDDAMLQIKKIMAKTGDSELTVVMSQIWVDKNEDGEEKLTSNIPKDANDYIALCKSFIEQSGYAGRAGKGLVLELGNECNMSHESNGSLFKSEAFSETVDAKAYANFYFETAKALKTSFPDIKLSLTGTAFYDYDFIEQVVGQVQVSIEVDESLKESGLIDVVSFHPYRKTVESPTSFLSNGLELSEDKLKNRANMHWDSLSDDKKESLRQEIFAGLTDEERDFALKLSNAEREAAFALKAYACFDYQLDSMKKLADGIGAGVTVGEVSFYKDRWGDSVDEVQQERNATYGREKGYFSLIWPGEQIIEHR